MCQGYRCEGNLDPPVANNWKKLILVCLFTLCVGGSSAKVLHHHKSLNLTQVCNDNENNIVKKPKYKWLRTEVF